ncbi:MAG: ABC transporter ATP-binding protein [Candidatus Zixiibacteriota bacterium]
MLRAESLEISFGKRKILDGIDFEIEIGDKVLLYGQNGSGKSTLARILAGVEQPDKGRVIIDGKEILADERRDLRIGLMLQNPEDSILTTEIARELAFPLEFSALPQEKMDAKIEKVAKRFGLGDYLHKSPEILSGGMMARLALAATVITGPDYIILDEPTSYLDYEGKMLFFNSLNEMKDKAIIFITQDPSYEKWADRVLCIENGKLAEGRISKRIDWSEKIATNPSEESILEAKGIEFSYEKNKVLNGIGLSIKKGSCTALIGKSGSGKSTLLFILAGLYKPDKGNVTGEGRVGMVFQFPSLQLFDKTVLDDVAYGPRNFKIENPYDRAKDALSRMGIGEGFYDANPFVLSEGEKRRVGIAGIISSMPELLILDEPTASLDKGSIERLIEVIKDYCHQNRSVIIVSHDLEFISQIADRAIVIHEGSIEFDGDIDSLRSRCSRFSKWGIGYQINI